MRLFGAGQESITTEFAWGDVRAVMLKIGSGGYGFRARAKEEARPGMTAIYSSTKVAVSAMLAREVR